MSNSPTNTEQSQPGANSHTTQPRSGQTIRLHFIEARDGGQRGASMAESAALLAEADSDAKSNLREPLPDRNEVPHRRYVNE
jgi:hypothetical protein